MTHRAEATVDNLWSGGLCCCWSRTLPTLALRIGLACVCCVSVKGVRNAPAGLSWRQRLPTGGGGKVCWLLPPTRGDGGWSDDERCSRHVWHRCGPYASPSNGRLEDSLFVAVSYSSASTALGLPSGALPRALWLLPRPQRVVMGSVVCGRGG